MWEFIKKEENARALSIVVPLLIALVGGAWAVLTYITSLPEKKAPEYSIYLDSKLTPFEDGFVDSYSAPYESTTKATENSNIWYLRRNRDFVPHSIDIFFEGISSLSKQEITQEIADIPNNKLLHETILPMGFYNIMQNAGRKLDGEYRDSLTSSDKEYASLSRILGVKFESPGSIAAFFMYHTKEGVNRVVDSEPEKIYKATRDIWFRSNNGDSLRKDDNLTNSLILGQFNPVLLLAISNPTGESVVLSDITVDAERILPSASGLKSKFIDVVDTVVIPLKGYDKESVNRKFHRPIIIPPGETASIRVIIDSELMFIYKISMALFNGSQEVHKFSPFIVDYFSEL